MRFLDPDGRIINTVISEFRMNVGPWSDSFINHSDDKMYKYGCAVTAMANIITTERTNQNGAQRDWLNVNPGIVNSNSGNFTGEKVDSLSFANTAARNGMTANKYDGKDAYSSLLKLNYSKDSAYAIAQVPYTTANGKTGKHWVNVNGQLQKDESGTQWISVGQTSQNDGKGRADNDSVNWKYEKGKSYVRADSITRLITVK